MDQESGSDPNCEFCRIAQGQAPALTVCRTDSALAFIPLEPVARGHTLVIPKRHVRDLWEISEEETELLMEAVRRVAHAIKTALQPDGLNLINSTGEAASQSVFHLHMHLVPRWKDDHIGEIWPPSPGWSESSVEAIADKIRDAC